VAKDYLTGNRLGMAMAEVLGLPSQGLLKIKVNMEPGELCSIDASFLLTADQVVAIGQLVCPSQQESQGLDAAAIREAIGLHAADLRGPDAEMAEA
jgi:hypothetical protein